MNIGLKRLKRKILNLYSSYHHLTFYIVNFKMIKSQASHRLKVYNRTKIKKESVIKEFDEVKFD